jgi:hypothetical protein
MDRDDAVRLLSDDELADLLEAGGEDPPMTLEAAIIEHPRHGSRAAPDHQLVRHVRVARGLTQRELAQRIADRLYDGREQARLQVMLSRFECGRSDQRTLPVAIYEALRAELAAAGWPAAANA